MLADQNLPITPRGIELNLAFARPFDAVHAARHLLRTARSATLSSLDPQSGYPYGTVTNLAVDADGTPFFFVSGLALHARNLMADSRASLALIDAEASDTLMCTRLTLVGRVGIVPAQAHPTLMERYLARFPKAKLYLSLPDARFCRLDVEALQIGGGPAQNANDATPAALRTELAGAEALIADEREEVRRLNETDSASRLALLAGARDGRWRIAGIDPDGIDLATSDDAARLWFKQRVTDLAALAAAFEEASLATVPAQDADGTATDEGSRAPS